MAAHQHARKRVPPGHQRHHVSLDQVLLAVALVGIVVAIVVALWSGV
jgi:hypothetical protein